MPSQNYIFLPGPWASKLPKISIFLTCLAKKYMFTPQNKYGPFQNSTILAFPKGIWTFTKFDIFNMPQMH
jgi:hypothetical protein